MKKIFFILCLTFSLFLKLSAGTTTNSNIEYFENKGQWDNKVLFKADIFGGWAFLEKNTITYMFMETDKILHRHNHNSQSRQDGNEDLDVHADENVPSIIKGHGYKVNYLNANETATCNGENKLAYYNNYFKGKNQTKWAQNVSGYKAIHYNNLYDNIDLKVYSASKFMKSDYIVKVGGEPKSIKLQYEGVDGISLEENGRLKVLTSINTIFEMKPYAYQIINGKEVEVACDFVLVDDIVSFNLPNGYDKSVELVIDPTLVFSTYSGSPSDNWGSSSTHDNLGNMFLGGISLGPDYPTTIGAFQTDFAGGEGFNETDVVITKFTANGNNRIYSTYLGGSANEMLSSLYCTPQNDLIVLMATGSSDYPTSNNAFDKTFNSGSATNVLDGSIDFASGSDIAITKLNSNGSALVGSTFLGGTGNDGLNLNSNLVFNYGDETRGDIAIDNNGNIFVTSTTTSTNFPGTSGKAQASNGGSSDGVIAKLNANLSALEWATYYGGSQADASYSMQIDGNNNIFICGGTTSSNLPSTTGGFKPTFSGGVADGFVAKLSNNGNTIISATYIGTTFYDQAHLMDLDKSNNIYLFGQSLGAYPVSAGVYSNTGAKQFIQKLNNNLTSSLYSTVFGRVNSSTINISPTALLVDVCENIYAVGWGGNVNFNGTTQNMPVTADAFDKTTDGSDFYLICLNRDADSLIYATYFGENGGVGDHVDGGTSRFDKNGVVYQAVCASCGGSNGFPTTNNAYSENNESSNCNMAGFKFRFDLLAMQIISTTATPPTGCAPLTTSFSYTSTRPGTSFTWDFGDGSPVSNAQFPSHTYTNPGTYTVKFILRNPQDCNPIDSSFVTVTVGTKTTSAIQRNICMGQKVTIGNQTFSTSGVYPVVLVGSNGCDSTVTLTLVVADSIITNKDASFCEGKSYTIGNQNFTQPGNYVIKFTTNVGCDSFVKLNLTQIPITRRNLSLEICEGDSVKIGNQVFSQSTNTQLTLVSSQDCDSIINLSLTVNPVFETIINREICDGDSIQIGNQFYSASGTYQIDFKSIKNCDSIVQLNLSLIPITTTNISRNICSGSSIQFGNQIFNATGTYNIVFQSVKNCDSLVVLDLTVTDTIFTDLAAGICSGTRYQIGDSIFTIAGNYMIPLKAIGGCDSIVNLSLTVLDSFVINLTESICKGDSIIIGNQVFDENGNYKIVLKASGGCDSIIYLGLTIIEPITTNKTDIICDGESIIIGNEIFDETGQYSVLLQSSLGCDSTVNLNLTVRDEIRTNINGAICQGESFLFGNQNLTEGGTYTNVLQSSTSCDSTILLTLVKNPNPIVNATVDSSLVFVGSEVQLNAVSQSQNLTYTWTPTNAVSNPLIANPTAVVQTNTLYFVVVEDRNGCSGLDSVLVEVKPFPNEDCMDENIFLPNGFSPNGDTKNDVYFVKSKIPLTSLLFIIYNRWGEKVFETNDQNIGWDGNYNGKAAIGDSFGYYFEGQCGDIIITKKGNITIVR
jgi:gliding motility-associated-like protein